MTAPSLCEVAVTGSSFQQRVGSDLPYGKGSTYRSSSNNRRTMSGDTRQRILTVANELFIEQGYEGTSLREIADRLDITKAALYYHFRSKDDILRVLLEPFDTLLDELLGRLEDAQDAEEWADALTWVVAQIFDYLDFFRLVDRNRHTVEMMMVAAQRNHAEMHARVEAAAHGAASS